VQLRFEVSDQGIGIDAEARGRLFELFTQADEAIDARAWRHRPGPGHRPPHRAPDGGRCRRDQSGRPRQYVLALHSAAASERQPASGGCDGSYALILMDMPIPALTADVLYEVVLRWLRKPQA
jgi:hypothetical protein